MHITRKRGSKKVIYQLAISRKLYEKYKAMYDI